MVAGIMPGMNVTSQSMELHPGETLVFYTDGVTEAFNAEGKMLGDAGLLEHLARHPGASAAETVASVLECVRHHAGAHPQSDDITVLAVRTD
jgi:sigma-B regulation protein RsbU (phosphoserine phosphatase)